MEFFVDNTHIEKKYKEIYKLIFKMRNGETHEEMSSLGLKYNKAFGVNVVSLKDLAKRYDKNHLLANKLWCSGLREGRIIATMLETYDMLDANQVERWIMEAETNEILEQLCMNLLVHSKEIKFKLSSWLASDELNKQKVALLLIARLSMLRKNNTDIDFEYQSDLLPPMTLMIEDSYVEKLCPRAYVRLASLSQENKELINAFFNELNKKNTNWSFICSEIKQELIYLK